MSGTPQGYSSYGQPHTGYQRVASTYTGTTYGGYHQHGQTAMVQPAQTQPPPPPQIPPTQHQAPQYQVQPAHQLQQQQQQQQPQQQTYQLHSVTVNSQTHAYPTPQTTAQTAHSVYQTQAPPPPPPPPQPTHTAYQPQHTAHTAYQTQPAAHQPTTHSVYQTQPPVPSPAQAPQAHSVYQTQPAAPQQTQPHTQQPPPQQPPPPPPQTYQTYGSQIAKARPQPISVTTTSPVNHAPLQSQQPQAYSYSAQNTTYPNVTVATRTTIGTEYQPLLKSRYYPTNDTSNSIKAPTQADAYHTPAQQPTLHTQQSQQQHYSYQDSVSDSQYQYKEVVNKSIYQAPYPDNNTLKTTYQPPTQYPTSTKLPTQYQANTKPPSPYQSNAKQVTTYQATPKPPTPYQSGTKLAAQYSVTPKTLTPYQTGSKPTTQFQSNTKHHSLHQSATKTQTQYQTGTKMLISFPNTTKPVNQFQNSPKLLTQYSGGIKPQSLYSPGNKPQFQPTTSLAKPQYPTVLSKTSYQSNTKTHYQSHFTETGTKPQYQYRKTTIPETRFDQYQESQQQQQQQQQQQNHSPYRYQQIKSNYGGESSLQNTVTQSVIRSLTEADSLNNVHKMTINDDRSGDTNKMAEPLSSASVSSPVPMITEMTPGTKDSEVADENTLTDTMTEKDEKMIEDEADSPDKKDIENGEKEHLTMKILKELMQPMLCKLCNVAMNAAIQSDQHYNGKNHAKKVRLFMLSGGTQLPATKNRPAVEYKPGQEIPVVTASHSSSNGQATTTIANTLVTSITDSNPTKTTSITTPNVTSSPISISTATTSTASSTLPSTCTSATTTTTTTTTISPVSGTSIVTATVELNSEIYCKICDACFNSPKQATQHYQGKNHAKKVRMSEAATKLAEAVGTGTVTESGNVFMCALCSVHVTSQEQLSSHLNGAKHKAKQRMQERQNNSKERESSNSGSRNYQSSRGSCTSARGGPSFRRGFRGSGPRGVMRGMRGDRGRGRGSFVGTGFGAGGGGSVGMGSFNGNGSFGGPPPDFSSSMGDFPNKTWGGGPSSFRGGSSGGSGTLNNYCYQPPPNKRPRSQDYSNFHSDQICDVTKPPA